MSYDITKEINNINIYNNTAKSYQHFINNFINFEMGDFRQARPQPNHTPPRGRMCQQRVTLLQIFFLKNFFVFLVVVFSSGQ